MARPPKEDLKERILSVATKKFYKNGFAVISLDEIVADARTSKSAVYKFYESKEDLVLAVLSLLNKEINTNIGLIINNSGFSFKQKLENIIKFTGNILKKVNRKFLEDLKAHTPDIWQLYLDMRNDRLKNYYLKLFKEGVKGGDIRKDIPVDFILFVYTKLTELVVNPDDLSSINISNKKAYDFVSKIFLEGAKP